MTAEERLQFALWLQDAEKQNTRVLKELMVEHGPIRYRDENNSEYIAGFVPTEKKFYPYTCNVAIEPFEIIISSSTDNHFGISLKQLSESEQFRFGVAFQIALAMATGLKFVVIDRADILDKERRKMLTGLLVNSGMDQAIVLATSEKPLTSITPHGVKFVSLVEMMKPCEAAPVAQLDRSSAF